MASRAGRQPRRNSTRAASRQPYTDAKAKCVRASGWAQLLLDCTLHPDRWWWRLLLYIPDVLYILYIRVVPPGMGMGPRYAGGGLVRVVRSFFRPARPQKRLGKARTPTPAASILADFVCSRSASNRCVRDSLRSRVMELPLVPLSASDKVRAHRFLFFPCP